MNKGMFIAGLLSLLLSAQVTWAQDDENDDEVEATIRLMGTAESRLPDAVTKEITLPPGLAEDSAAVENAERGLERANEVRQNREERENGLSRAEEARERGQEMADEARQNREDRGRSEDRRRDPPDPPGRPDTG